MRNFTVDEVGAYLARGFWQEVGNALPPRLDANISVNINTLSAANQALAKWAMMAWSELGFTFTLTAAQSADIMLRDDFRGGYTNWHERGGMPLVNVGPDFSTYYGSRLDGYTYQSWLHELGHALGLGHTGAYNGTGTYGVDNHFINDSWQMSVMSYFPQDENTSINASFAYVLTPMPGDIAGIEKLYDLNPRQDVGNTVYFWDTTAPGIHGVIGREIAAGRLTEPVAMTIKDAGGIDTLNFRGAGQAINLDLRPGSINSAFGLRGNILIERNTIIENVVGSTANDVIRGQWADNRLDGGAGNDLIEGRDGHDILLGRAGNDTLRGGNGNDTLIGGVGADILDGSAGLDTVRYENLAAIVDLQTQSVNAGAALGDRLIGIEAIEGSTANDRLLGDAAGNRLSGGAGQDYLEGRFGNDTLMGGDGNDTLAGGEGHDTLIGGAGHDTLVGGGGNDRLVGGTGADVLRGEAGTDIAQYDQAAIVDLVNGTANAGAAAGDILHSIENLSGSQFADKLFGNHVANQLFGAGGNDLLDGRGGNDLLMGGDGHDTLIGGAGSDTLSGGAGNDRLIGQAGSDLLEGGLGSDVFEFRGSYTRIVDFQNDLDDLVLNRGTLGLAGATVSDILAMASVAGGHTYLNLGNGNTVVLHNIANINDLANDLILI